MNAAIGDDLDPVLEEAAQLVANRARQRVPTQSGRLQQSIRVIRFDTCQYNVVADAVAPQDKTALPYGIMVEFGTEAGGRGGGNAPPQPFMGPAVDESADEIVGMINDKMRQL